MNLRSSCVLPCLVVLTACSTSERDSASPATVRSYGALRSMFHDNDVSSKIRLGELLPDPDLYGVGALSELRGEVTILAGEVVLSYPLAGSSIRSQSTLFSDERATLLVAASVDRWQRTVVPGDVPFAGLDDEVRALADAAGVDVSVPFPFLITGEVEDLRSHVIDGTRLPAGPTSHEDHLKAGVPVGLARGRVTLVGFYSEQHQGVFTHHASRTHVHCVLDEPHCTGHVDEVTVLAGAELLLP